MIETTQERREYFRVNDQAVITINKVPEDQALPALLNQKSSFTIRSAMNTLELQHQALSSQIKRSSPEIFHYFDIINQKIDLITQHLVQTSTDYQNKTTTKIDLSASGVAFSCTDNYSVNDHVSVQLLLLPENNGIICLGHIKQIDITEDGNRIAIDFSEINEADRELIIKHTMKKQLEEARNKKN